MSALAALFDLYYPFKRGRMHESHSWFSLLSVSCYNTGRREGLRGLGSPAPVRAKRPRRRAELKLTNTSAKHHPMVVILSARTYWTPHAHRTEHVNCLASHLWWLAEDDIPISLFFGPWLIMTNFHAQ